MNELNYEIPVTEHKVFEELVNILGLVISHMPNCGCGRYFRDFNKIDPTCHRHAWLTSDEVQRLYNIHSVAIKLQDKEKSR